MREDRMRMEYEVSDSVHCIGIKYGREKVYEGSVEMSIK